MEVLIGYLQAGCCKISVVQWKESVASFIYNLVPRRYQLLDESRPVLCQMLVARCWLQDAGCKKTEFIASPVYPEGCCRWAVTSKLFSKRKLHTKFDYWGAKKIRGTLDFTGCRELHQLGILKVGVLFFLAINLVNFWLLQEILTELWKPIWRFKYEDVVTQQSYESHVSQSYERDHENSVSDTQRQRGSYLKYEEAVIQRSHGICGRETQRAHGCHSITGIVTQRYHGNSATDTQRQHGSY